MNNQKKAIFLDRDGVINKKRNDYVKNVRELEIFSFVADSIKKLKEMGFIILVITNQSAINRGIASHQDVIEIHNAIQEYLLSYNTSIDKFYYCPHKPEENCHCRKPRNELFLRSIQEWRIKPEESWVIGDSDSDIIAGQSIGCKTIKIGKNLSLEEAVSVIATSHSINQ